MLVVVCPKCGEKKRIYHAETKFNESKKFRCGNCNIEFNYNEAEFNEY